MESTQIINRGKTLEYYDSEKLKRYIQRYTPSGVDVDFIVEMVNEFVAMENGAAITSTDIQEEVYSIVEGLISTKESFWQNVAGAVKMDILRKAVFFNRGFEAGYSEMLKLAHKNKKYTNWIEKYTDEELQELEEVIDYSFDQFNSHVGAAIAYDRYVTIIPVKKTIYDHISEKEKDITTGMANIETLQERYLSIAAVLLQDEDKEKRLALIKDAYYRMATQQFTPATPTFMNAGRYNGNLSSCFVGMSKDSIDGIYKDAEQFAKISKNAGGYGTYWGKVRSIKSAIKGVPELSSGSTPFMKLMNVTASAVDQQGKRAGAVTITLDVWHRDLTDFLKAPLNNTVLEKQMHNIFLAVSMPDIFFKRLKEQKPWYQFDPHEVKEVMGYSIEDYYDEEKENGTFSRKYEELIQAYNNGYLQLVTETTPLAVLSQINKTRSEKGHPFLFFRDTVNRDNPNKGIIYCSNLCTEIAIVMSEGQYTTDVIDVDGEEVIIQKHVPGDIPTCNLSSLNLSKVAKVRLEGGDWKKYIADVVAIQYRLLASVVQHNDHGEMVQTYISSKRKREVGLGVMGLAHALAISKIAIDSDAANEWQREVFDVIAYETVKASMNYAVEKGDVAPKFKESKWADGSYITEKFMANSNEKEKWIALRNQVVNNGMYSTTLMATAPTETISYIANTTAGADPVFNKEFTIQKAGIKTNLVVPDIDSSNYFYYKDAFSINKSKFIEGVGIRQQFIDQAISTNLYYIKEQLTPLEAIQDILDLYKNDCKTAYYQRSQSQQAYELACESCGG